ncbi:MAG: hypothetical protein COV34_02180 [Candidatus Zambryskibacteria bacterium CG10_big_fil_rev_8_21_14_0_10_42_12]|uniref:SMC-Scp complex subunit ScpB n=1 Tax=Candidatus Zambryskibacteria bacterium CG10_big_fil_rev_8_21_14_0_10_42_12 TaxID=1975115 RepID=A0A2H0QVT4_9BACT|nr:MAG: hypothetical protein COV34_02180 [Candidatus Zambryskibacteria bacterium CG10_big_fil_rev_8_21_14_0_10_42_12]
MDQHTLSLEAQIEAILFYKGEGVKESELIKTLGTDEQSFKDAVLNLRENLSGRGLTLLEHDGIIALGTAQGAHGLIEKITKEELTRDLGRAGLETLSIVLYKGPVNRREIDYIRGVNSSFILRNLLMRGLIERVDDKAGRGYSYKPSLDLLMHLGISRIDELPDYHKVKEELERFGKSEDNGDNAVV